MRDLKIFPQVLFVTVEGEGKDEYLSASTTKRIALQDYGKKIIGVYQFVYSEEVSEGQPIVRKLKNRRTK